mgnify:CR=1 FL=1
MDETEFNRLSEGTLKAIAAAIDASGLDCDSEFKAEGVLEIEFDDGARMVINRHAAAREIWVAAKSGGFHFRHQAGRWVDSRSGQELFSALSDLLSRNSGTRVDLAGR